MTPIRLCQHIKVNGVQCGTPALHDSDFCHFHALYRERALRRLRAGKKIRREFPLLEDANCIQLALMQTIDDIVHDRLTHKQASLVLYALQTAAINQRRTSFEPVSLRYPLVNFSAPQA